MLNKRPKNINEQEEISRRIKRKKLRKWEVGGRKTEHRITGKAKLVAEMLTSARIGATEERR